MKAVFVDMDDMLQEYTIPTKSDMRALVKVGVSVGTLLDAGNQAEPPPPPPPAVGGWPTHQPGDHILKFFGALRITPNSYEAFAGAVKEISGLVEASYVGVGERRRRQTLPTRLAPAHICARSASTRAKLTGHGVVGHGRSRQACVLTAMPQPTAPVPSRHP